MAGPGRTPKKKSRRWLYTAIVLLAVLVAAVYALVGTSPPKPAMDFTFGVTMQYYKNGQYQFLILPAIGVPGGTWNSHQYDGFGLDNHYPVYTDPPTNPYPGYSLVHVRSTVVRNYTLGDFFAVYGQPLGRNDTLNILAVPNGSFWDMCVGSPPAIRPGLWAGEVLASNQNITLVYGTTCI